MPTSVSLLPVAGWLCLLLAVGVGARQLRGTASPRVQWGFWLLLGAALLCFRWPLISLPHELYPDESQLLAGAITLRYDSLFWRALDMGTAGPLDCYVLMPAAWFPGVAAYAVARVIGTLLVWATLVAIGEALAGITGLAMARVAALPALLFLTFTTSPEYIHHSTELVANLLVALAVLAGARQLRAPAPRYLWMAGLLLGAVPWAKLQLVPLAGAFGMLLIACEWSAGRRREILQLIVAALLPTLLVFVVLTVSDQMEHMIVPYLMQNFLYVQTGRQPLALVAHRQWDQAVTNGYIATWLAGAVLMSAITAIVCRRKIAPATRSLALCALGTLGVATLCILAPGRPYPHYLQLLLIPVTLLVGVAIVPWFAPAANPPGARAGLLLFFLSLVAPLLALRLSPRPDPYAYYNLIATAPSAGHRELVAKLQSLSRPGEALGLWGWRSSLYVETGLRQATHESHPLALLITGPGQAYYLRTYYEKFVANAPPVFVDATGPGNFYFTDRRQGHQLFPRLRDWVQANYTLVAELDGARVYARNDRLAASLR